MTTTDLQALAEGVADAVRTERLTYVGAETFASIVRHVRAALEGFHPRLLVSDADGVRLEEIRKRAEAATPGPWTVDAVTQEAMQEVCLDYEIEGAGSPILVALVHDDEHAGIDTKQAEANARHIAAARTDIPYLLSLVAHYSSLLNDALEDRGEDVRTRRAISQAISQAISAERSRITADMEAEGNGEASRPRKPAPEEQAP